MTLDAIREYLSRRPFQSFLIRLSNGDTYAVRHPDQAMPLKNGLLIGLPASDGEISDRFVHASYLHVAAIETPAPQKAA